MISLCSDIDDIPQANQKPGVGYHDPLVPGAPGHGEGHNSGMPLNITAAIAVKKIMERDHIPGTLQLWPGVAEEQMAAKAYFVRAGVFKDVDAVLFCHVSADFGVSYGTSGSNALISAQFNFLGSSAHAAGAPWAGRSALDAVDHFCTQISQDVLLNEPGMQPKLPKPKPRRLPLRREPIGLKRGRPKRNSRRREQKNWRANRIPTQCPSTTPAKKH